MLNIQLVNLIYEYHFLFYNLVLFGDCFWIHDTVSIVLVPIGFRSISRANLQCLAA
jgi:hypothetical protein